MKNYLNSLKTKVVLLISLIVLLFISSLFSYKIFENKRESYLIEEAKTSNLRYLTENINYHSSKLKSFLFDYSSKKEIINLLESKNIENANISFSSLNNIHDIDYVILFNKRLDKLFVEKDFRKVNKIDLSDFIKNVEKEKYTKSFQLLDNQVLEIHSLPIFKSTITNNKNEYLGSLIAVKVWDDNFISQLQAKTSSKLSVVFNKYNLSGKNPVSENIVELPLMNSGNKPIAFLYSQKDDRLAESFSNFYSFQLDFTIILAVTTLIIILLFFYFYLLKPVTILEKSIKNKDESILKELDNNYSEFNNLSNAILDLHKGRKELENQVAKSKEIEKELELRIENENLASSISTMFINVNFDDINGAINNALAVVSSFLRADRAYIFLFDEENNQRLINNNFWRNPKINIRVDNFFHISVDQIPNVIDKLKFYETIFLDSSIIEKNNFEEEKVFFKRFSIKSIVFVPLFQGKQLKGFWGVDFINEEFQLSEYQINFLLMTSSIFANALERESNDEKIKSANIIIENSPSVLFRIKNSEDYKITYISPNIKRYGYSVQEIISGKFKLEEIVYPHDFILMKDEFQYYIKNNINEFSEEYRIVSKDKKIYWIDDRVKIIRDYNGNVLHYEGVFIDITEKKNIEEKLKASDEKYKYVVNNLIEVIFQSDQKGNFTFLNPAWEEITNFTIEESLGQNFLNFIHPDDREIDSQLFNNLIELKKENFKHTFRYLNKGGIVKWIEVNARLIINEKEEITGISGTLVDVTERIESEEALRIKDNAIISSHNGIVIIDALDENLPIIFSNPAFSQITGYELEEVLDKNLDLLFRNSPNNEDIGIFNNAFKNNEGCELVVKNYRKNNESFWNELKISPIRNEKNKITHYVGIISDVTSRILVEEEIKKSLVRQKELNDLKSKFVSMISHEFRTPLTTIFSSAELLERYSYKWDIEKQKQHFLRIKKASETLTDMLNYILTINKAEAGKIKNEPVKADIVKFCQDISDEFQLNSGENYNIIYNANGIDQSEPYFDEKLLRQLLSNLLSNAIKYSPLGGNIYFTISNNNDIFSFIIKDNGIGIDEKDQDKIFEMFNRGNNVGNINGTGLGLAIVKKTVDLLKGEINLESKAGQGTTFKIILTLDYKEN